MNLNHYTVGFWEKKIKSKVEGLSIPNFKTYCKAAVIKTVWQWHKDRLIDRQNKIESPDIGPCSYSQLIWGKIAKVIIGGADSLLNKWCWDNYIPAYKKS